MRVDNAPVRLDVDDLSAELRYAVLSGVVVPRPVAWITTVCPGGTVNLAPFSFFNAASGNPPTLTVSIEDRDGGGNKDTLENLLRTGVAIVHTVDEAVVEAAVHSSMDFPREQNEAAELGLETVPGSFVPVPRLVVAPVAMECRLEQHLRVGNDSTLVILRVVGFHLGANLLHDDRIAVGQLHAVGRMGGPYFTRTRDYFEMRVGSYSEWLARVKR